MKFLTFCLSACLAMGSLYSQNAASTKLPPVLSETWQVFTNVSAPKSLGEIPGSLPSPDGKTVPAKTVKSTDGAIDLAALAGSWKAKDVAVLYNEFMSKKAGSVRFGAAADWWMEIYLNGKQILNTMEKGNGSNSFSPNNHVFDLPVKAGKNLLTVKVLSGIDGWRFVCGIPAASSARPNIKFTANDQWQAVDMSDVQVKEGSALDLNNVASFAGNMARLTIGPTGKLTAAGRPDEPVRLKGYNFNWPFFNKSFTKEDIAAMVRLSRLQGYNFLRFMYCDAMAVQADMKLSPVLLDKMDYLLSLMNKNGLYLHITIFAYNHFMKDQNKQMKQCGENKLLMYLGDPQLRKQWQFGAETLMNHVNPYTGVAWKNDPTIAVVEFFNEQEFAFDRRIKQKSSKTVEKFNVRFRDWLKAKYHTPEALAKAWNDPKILSFDAVSIPDKGISSSESKAKMDDFIQLCNELSSECSRWCESTLRKTGYTGLTGQFNLPLWFGDNVARFETSQVALRNNYFHYPTGPNIKGFGTDGSRCVQNSSVGEAGSYWRQSNATRFADRPFIMTEFNHPYWNPYQHECGLLFSAYSALQGFDGLVSHFRGPADLLKANNHLTPYRIDVNPIARANEFISACLYLRGDVKPSPHRIQLDIPRTFSSLGAISASQDKIGLMSGFTISFPWTKPPQGLAVLGKADLSITPSGAAIVKTGDWSSEVIDQGNGKFSLDRFTAMMKEKGILPKTNLSDPDRGIFQSDTGEITMRSQENLLKVVTPRSEAVTLEGGKTEPVGKLKIIRTSVPACVAVCAMDGRNLTDSKRIVLVYSTEAASTDFELSADRVEAIKCGRLPILLKTGTLNATLNNVNGAKMSLYALRMDGSQREKLPLTYGNGILAISLDTAKLKHGPTVFFELATE